MADIFDLYFTIGNTHKLEKNPKLTKQGNMRNKHNWTAFVRIADRHKPQIKLGMLVEKVKFQLHETFRPNVRIEKLKKGKEQIEITYSGWGYFDLPVTIYFKKETGLEPMSVEFELNFDDNGAWRDYKTRISRKKLGAITKL